MVDINKKDIGRRIIINVIIIPIIIILMFPLSILLDFIFYPFQIASTMGGFIIGILSSIFFILFGYNLNDMLKLNFPK